MILYLALTAALAAQGTISDDNVTYTVGAIPFIATESVHCDFSADAAIRDVAVQQWWWYRLDGDSDERLFRNDGTLSQRYEGSHADLFWSDVDQRRRIRAHLGLDVVSTGPTSGIVYSKMTILNFSDEPVAIDVFHYADVDACDTPTNAASGDRNTHVVTASCQNDSVEVSSLWTERWCAAPRDGTECGIAAPGSIDLPNSGLPFANGDYTTARQWTRVVLPDQFITVYVRLEHKPGARPPASSTNYGRGSAGTNGVPTLTTTRLPVVGTTAELTVQNAFPNVTGMMLFGFGRTEISYINLKLFVLPGPRGYQFDFFFVPTDATGTAVLPLPLPPSPQLYGEMVHWQYVCPDPGVTGFLPWTHTDAVEWVLGG